MAASAVGPPAPHPAIETAFVDAQAVLFDERTGEVLELNPSASAVWLLLDGESTIEAIAADLHELTGVPIDVLTTDVETAVNEFGERGLLAGESAEPEVESAADYGPEADTAPVVLPRPPDP